MNSYEKLEMDVEVKVSELNKIISKLGKEIEGGNVVFVKSSNRKIYELKKVVRSNVKELDILGVKILEGMKKLEKMGSVKI